ncbi:MAG: M24 family metallopeptidase [Promethearchaeota archaeon]
MKRWNKIKGEMQKKDISVLITWHPPHTVYLSTFFALTYSRPIITIFPLEQEPTLIVPALDEEHAKKESVINDIRSYVEFPLEKDEEKKETDPFQITKQVVETLGLHKRNIGIEEKYCPLSSISLLKTIFPKATFSDTSEIIEQLRMVKSRNEIEAVTRAAELAAYGVSRTIEKATEGLTEIQLDTMGNNAILERSSIDFPESVLRFTVNMSPSGPVRSALPHVFSTSRKLKEGDSVIHTRVVSLSGYHGECERTFIIGKPSQKQEKMFETMCTAQQAIINAIKPGTKVSELDRIARGIITKAGFGKYFIHRSGHGIGLELHERPSLKEEDPTILEPGHIFSVEPGIYIPEFGGMRHSDTVLVTEDSYKILTDFPKDLSSLTV